MCVRLRVFVCVCVFGVGAKVAPVKAAAAVVDPVSAANEGLLNVNRDRRRYRLPSLYSRPRSLHRNKDGDKNRRK